MFQRKFIQTIIFMFGGGLIGMVISYILFGHTAGDYISPRAIFFASGIFLEDATPSLSEIVAMRNNILAGGVAGMLAGLLSPALFTYLQNRI